MICSFWPLRAAGPQAVTVTAAIATRTSAIRNPTVRMRIRGAIVASLRLLFAPPQYSLPRDGAVTRVTVSAMKFDALSNRDAICFS